MNQTLANIISAILLAAAVMLILASASCDDAACRKFPPSIPPGVGCPQDMK